MNTREKMIELEESAEHERRLAVIAQNGNDGLAYETTMTYEQDLINKFDVVGAEKVCKDECNPSDCYWDDICCNDCDDCNSKPLDKAAQRKATPVFSGFLAYFADAINEVARCSMAGQLQHAPDEPLKWHREKSGDELDALARHLLQAGSMDDDSVRHSSKIAWRAMANLQKELELAGEAPLSKYNKSGKLT